MFSFLSVAPAQAGVATPDEMLATRQWVAAKFEGKQERPSLDVGLIVRANNDPVQKNSRAGQPLKIVGRRVHARSLLPCRE